MTEQAGLDRWERRADLPLAVIAVVFLVACSFRVLAQPHGITARLVDTLTVASWMTFVVDYAARLWLAPNRQNWFLRHPLYLAAVVLPLLQPLRLVRPVIRLGAVQKVIGNAIHGRVMVYTIAGAWFFVYGASLAELQAERHDANATINNFGNALWWSMTTITTVGYGNIYPITGAGRIIAALLMIGGITLVGMITATIASWIVHRVTEEAAPSQPITAPDIDLLRREIRALRDLLSEGGNGSDA